jgi:protein involved in polysaccharide export with SLBB domain
MPGCKSAPEGPAGPKGPLPVISEGPPPRFSDAAQVAPVTADLYRVGARDRIRIEVARHAEFGGEVTVDPRGRIVLPTSNTEISVSGLDSIQVARKIAMEIRPYVVRAPRVRVEVLDAKSKSYYVVGGVNRPGRYNIGQVPVTIRDALLSAGLPDGGSELEKVVLIKADPVKPQRVPLDASGILQGKLANNVRLRDGDIIFVPTDTYSQVNRMMVDLELHLERGLSMGRLHDFVRNNLFSKSSK